MEALCEKSLLPALPLVLGRLHSCDRGPLWQWQKVPPVRAWAANVQAVGLVSL